MTALGVGWSSTRAIARLLSGSAGDVRGGTVMISDDSLDAVLALQLSVAWAGEGRAQPRRLGWWETDLVDDAGGGDLFARLLPRTRGWAALEAVREAARRVDERTRLRAGLPDQTFTLFRFGFALDERLSERLGAHKRVGATPADVLGARWGIRDRFDSTAFAAWCGDQAPRLRTEDTPDGGRRLISGTASLAPNDPLPLARVLVSALAPLGAEYPMPHLRTEP